MAYYGNERDQDADLAICEVCEEDCSISEAEGNHREWGLAICDGCVEGGLECGALPIGGSQCGALPAVDASRSAR